MGQGHVAGPSGTSTAPTPSLSSQLAAPADSSNTEGATVSAGCRTHTTELTGRNRTEPGQNYQPPTFGVPMQGAEAGHAVLKGRKPADMMS